MAASPHCHMAFGLRQCVLDSLKPQVRLPPSATTTPCFCRLAMGQISEAKNQQLPPLPLPPGITSRIVPDTVTGLDMHILEAGYDPSRTKPLILLLHGFPELAYSWRKVMLPLCSAGYYVVAPDQRGYGRTTGWDTSGYASVDLGQFSMTQLVTDMVVLVSALGYKKVRCVVGHDFGAVSASMCALMRPDIFGSTLLMSHPYKPPAPLPFNVAHTGPEGRRSQNQENIVGRDVQGDLAKLSPPRKHYKWYNSTEGAAREWENPPQGMTDYLRGYYHLKSADWSQNEPRPLREWSAEELAKMPEYYVMPQDKSMPGVVSTNMAGENAKATERWLSDDELNVYVDEWNRTGFQGGLNWYRSLTDPKRRDLDLFAGRKIDVPSKFVSGKADWGNYQQPGVIEKLPESCGDFRGTVILDGAGHWPQQEQPTSVAEEILKFVTGL
ncbi:Alpha/Beta hydrolase protein [Phyllosticta citriasiana]|uniref:Alpha/Beta hydrolase protein n=1 Tax=Phyllosticta citriasiana TaxID=595635 RepID=A0ABR1KIV7_9PEZI